MFWCNKSTARSGGRRTKKLQLFNERRKRKTCLDFFLRFRFSLVFVLLSASAPLQFVFSFFSLFNDPKKPFLCCLIGALMFLNLIFKCFFLLLENAWSPASGDEVFLVFRDKKKKPKWGEKRKGNKRKSERERSYQTFSFRCLNIIKMHIRLFFFCPQSQPPRSGGFRKKSETEKREKCMRRVQRRKRDATSRKKKLQRVL